MNKELEKEMSEMIEQEEVPKPREKYKSTKGDLDRRKITAKVNLAKGRAAKLEKLRQQREEDQNEYEIDTQSESESESSEEEPKKKTKRYVEQKPNTSHFEEHIKALEAKLAKMEKAKKKAKKRPIKKTVIQLQPYHQPTVGGKLKNLLDL